MHLMPSAKSFERIICAEGAGLSSDGRSTDARKCSRIKARDVMLVSSAREASRSGKVYMIQVHLMLSAQAALTVVAEPRASGEINNSLHIEQASTEQQPRHA